MTTPHIRLSHVTVRYPVFNSHTRSLKTAVFSKLGGRLATHNQTTVVHALDDISMELNVGDRLALVGHNGAGKTTLLRVLSQVYEPQEGEVDIQGAVSSFTDLSLGMDPEANGWDNIIFRCAFMGMTFREARDLTPSIAEFSGLGEFLDMPVRTYSSGMFVRLAFAIVTSVQPDIIVMDEMINMGDAEFVQKAQARLHDILEGAKVMVIATHDESMVRRFCNKAAWLEKGRLMGFGETEHILEQYRLSREAEYARHLTSATAANSAA